MFSKELTNTFKNLCRRSARLRPAPLTVLAISIPVVVAMSACSGSVDLSQKEQQLGSKDATRGGEHIIWPDSPPSVADGKVYWEQNNCASCHGADGKGAGQGTLDLTNAELMRSRKPIDQFRLIAFGACTFEKTPTTSTISNGTYNEAEAPKGVEMKHEAYSGKLKTRQLWDLVFYTRSLSVPLLSAEDRAAMKAVWGANCAVCHGTRGAGDGPLNKGLVLQPNPANFNQFDRFYDRTDEQLWDHIANGIKWEAMPNFLGKTDRGNKVTFDADYIWKLVQYVRNFHEDSDFALEGPKKAMLDNPAVQKTSVTKMSPGKPAETHAGSPSATTKLEGHQPVRQSSNLQTKEVSAFPAKEAPALELSAARPANKISLQ